MECVAMTEHKTMNTIIHAAFRRDVQRFDAALAAFPAGSRQRADQLATAWDNFAFQLDHHHEDEETIFWPALRSLGAPESLAGDLEGEHAQMLVALESAKASMREFRAAPDADATTTARAAIAHLADVLTNHLAHEERDMEPISAAHHASAQIKAAQKTVRKAHRGNQGTLFAWLLDGADADAIRGLRREVPRPVLFVITRTAGRRYNRTIRPTWA
jgi:hemerythrin-like domain-containing protein